MINITPQNAASTKITVTNSAAELFTLMDTAGSISTSKTYYVGKGASGVMITPEDGSVRVLFNATPTSSLGDLLKEGTRYYFPGVDPTQLTLIRAGSSNVLASVTLFVSKDGESPTAVADPANAGSESGVYAGDSAGSITDNGVMELTLRQDTPIEDTSADGDRQVAKSDNVGARYVHEVNRPGYEDNTNNIARVEMSPTTSTSNGWLPYQGQALDDGQVIVATACKVKSVTALIDTAAASDEYFLHVIDAAAVPANGAVTLAAPPVSVQHTAGTQSAIVIDFSEPGVSFTTGLTVYISTTQITKTIAGSVAIFSAEYVS